MGHPLDLPTIAVALCTHNGELFIRQQLETILSQDFLPVQVVLSDDDSRDDTVPIAEEIFSNFREAHPGTTTQLTVLRNVPALGVAKNFEQAMRACSAELLALSDQDDIWLPGRLRSIAEVFASRNDLTFLHGDALLIDSQGNPLAQSLLEVLGAKEWEMRSIADGDARRVFIRRNLATGATSVFRRSLVDAALPVPEGWVHDEWLAIVAAFTGTVDCDRRRLVGYRQHSANQIGVTPLTVRSGFARLTEPRGQRNARLLVRATELAGRVSDAKDLGPLVVGDARSIVAGKLRHETFRSGLPRHRVTRLVPILRTAIRGDYCSYGLGARDMLRDLLQPA